MQTTAHKRQVLLVSIAGDELASELVDLLRAAGVDILVAQTVGLASRADEYAICIIVLRSGIWRTSSVITTAVRTNPRYMIPVLAEPMALPESTWATEAISRSDVVSDMAHALEALIAKELQVLPRDGHMTTPPPTESQALSPKRRWPEQASMRPRLYKRRLNNLYRYILIALIIVLAVVLLIYYIPRMKAATPPANAIGGVPVAVSLLDKDYTASVPGPGCTGTTDSWWGTGDHFKTYGTPTVTATQTIAQATPTGQVVVDNSTQASCQQNGLLVKKTKYYDVFANVIFASPDNDALPQHFSTQVSASAISPTNAATFMLGVRGQDNASNGYNSNDDVGYGDDAMIVGVDGSWQAVRYNDASGLVDTHFTQGFVKSERTYTLGAEVNGARITFSINGQNVTTIVDTTYSAGYSIDFGLDDPAAKGASSALYSHFVYKPFTNSGLTTQAAVATATAQTVQNFQTPYSAVVPGPGCNQGTGEWAPVTKEKNYVTTSCLANGLAVTQDALDQYSGDVDFYGLDGNFPANYRVKVQIDTSGFKDGCAGVMTRTDADGAGYRFSVCSDGAWQIEHFGTGGGDGQKLAEGQTAAHTTYMLEATSNGATQGLVLDGVSVATVNDGSLKTTDHIELCVSLSQGEAGTAVFANFVYTPLP